MIAVAVVAMALGGTPVWADDKPSADEEAKIKATVAAWGCEGGTFEKETESTGTFEANDVKCRGGTNYDFKLDKSLNVLAISID
jgi:hypothetical protein